MLTSARQNGFLAIKVPRTGDAGRLVRGGANAPKLVLRDFPSGGKETAVELAPRDDLLPVINALLPIVPGENAHWEALSLPSTYTLTWPCGRNEALGSLRYALDLGGASCEDWPVEEALAAGASRDVFAKRTLSAGAQGFDQIALTATGRSDARISYTVYDNVGVATDWWQAILLRWSYLPVSRRQ